MESYRRFSNPNPKDIQKFLDFIANNPTADSDTLIRKSMEMGFHPREMIDLALGSVKYEKSKANLDKPIVDILNDIYEKDPTPGRRYVVEPSEAISKKAKEISKNLGKDIGIAEALDIGKPRLLPDYSAVKEAYSESEKLRRIADAGHELKHQEDYLIRPDFVTTEDKPYRKGHHYGDIYETKELLRETKDLPQDEKVVKEIVKQSKKSGLKPSVFTRLRSVLGFIPTAVATGLAAYAPESKAASIPLKVLEEGDPSSLLFPSGAGEGEEEEIKKMYEEARKNKFKNIKEKLK